ncbi:MAG: DNA topoisomerase (ATP-hydrolyzing) subunit B [Patescibacteria group bacterium]
MAKNKENEPKKEVSYDAKDIYVLEGLEPVRKRPGMYIGSTGVEGLHHLIWEVMDNSIDEAMAGYAKNIRIEILKGERIVVVDDGRGIPVDIHPQTKKSALDTVLTTLHAGGKFGGESYKVSGGLHGVGVSVVNALSKWLKVEVYRNGAVYTQEYERGKPKFNVKKVGISKHTGTKVIFDADPVIFQKIEYDRKKILDHLRQQSYLTKGVRISFVDDRDEHPFYYGFYFDGGLKSFIHYLIGDEPTLQDEPFYAHKSYENIEVEVVFTYADDQEAKELSFANNIHTPDGGMHLTGLRSAMTRVLNDYARKENYLKESEENITGDDIREGLVSIVSIKLPEPQFEGQTKARLGNPEARTAVEMVVSETLKEFLEKHGSDGRKIIEKNLLAAKARKAAKAAKDTVLRKGALEGLTLPGKLADCSSRKAEDSELFIVEGDSAGGCFDGNTKVALTDGRNLTFKELVEEDKKGKENFCYTIQKNGSIGIAPITNPRITKKNAEAIKVILDNDEELICTPDHRFMLADGSYEEAQNLQKTNSLMPLYRQYSKLGKRITIDGYEMVFDPAEKRWIFTHLLSDKYNLENGKYSAVSGYYRHHKDFNKLNNDPENIMRLSKEEHLSIHRKMAYLTLQRPDVIEKLRILRQKPEFRKKINELLDKSQRKYWSNEDNRKLQAERVKSFFVEHPEKLKEYSELARIQWNDGNLLKWRSEKTKEQWTLEFRAKRRNTYNETYREKAMRVLRDLYDRTGAISIEKYDEFRRKTNDKSLLRFDTILNRFFEGRKERLFDAVIHYNHKIIRIEKMSERIDVYDLEVPGTHNFALASGIFVHNSAKQGRDRHTQAILPLKGKILNVEKSRIDKMLMNKEIRSLVIALGTAISENFDIEKLRYHKIILMTDADVDGAHIRTLLLTLFFRYFPKIIENGHLYVAQPPLFQLQKGKESHYAYSDAERDKIHKQMGSEGINVQRYKGLGEMNPSQLWETTMDPAKRILKQINIEDVVAADKMFDILMGEIVEPRKNFIQAHALTVKNLDI